MPPSCDDTDGKLIARAREGGADGQQAFAQLYHRHRDWAFRLARRHCPDEATALDLAHDAFIALLNELPRLELTASLRTWLYRVIRNRSLDLARREARRSRIRLRIAAASRPGAAPPGDQPENEPLREALASLTDRQREVLLMRVVDGMSVDEVATALEVAPGTVKSRLHHALAALRQHPAALSYFEQPSPR